MPAKLTQEEFIERCKIANNDRYNYSNTVYVNMDSEITYVCPKHGVITQCARDHAEGHGCRYCAHEKSHYVRLSTKEEFIEKAKEVHGDRYDYSKVEYYNNNTPVCIICPEHGEFWKTPHAHKAGEGCQKCALKSKTISTTFIEDAKRVHGDKYDYSKAVYRGRRESVDIICPRHGVFQEIAVNHLKGCGCKLCSNNVVSLVEFKFQNTILYGEKYTIPETISIKSNNDIVEIYDNEKKINKKVRVKNFIEGNDKEVIENRKEYNTKLFFDTIKETQKNTDYDYSLVDFTRMGDKIQIICPKHGVFNQCVKSHMEGGICNECRKEQRKDTKETFIEKAKKKHGNTYDYSITEYVDSQTPINIICHEKDVLGNEHGIFKVKPNSHIQGHGCPKCYGRNKTTDVWVAEMKRIVPEGLYTFEHVNYRGARNDVMVTCVKHGDFLIKPNDFKKLHGCPVCNMSKIEIEVMKLLQDNNIKYEMHTRNDFLSGLTLDFYLVDYNIGIECQGEQHYVEKEHFKSERENLGIRQERDARKKKLCGENGVELIYYLENRYAKYQNKEDIFFTDKMELLKYIKDKDFSNVKTEEMSFEEEGSIDE